MAVGRHPEKWKNRDISTSALPVLMKFVMVMHLGSRSLSVYKIKGI